MEHRIRHLFPSGHLLLVFLLIGTLHLIPAYAHAGQIVGAVTAVQKNVNVVHPGKAERLLVHQGDDVLFADAYQTGPGSSTKLLFRDDSLITLGENSRLRITENIFNPEKKQRNTVLELLSGSARALVGKSFSGLKPKFEVHTPTTKAAAKGTYFIVKFDREKWLSEIFNISRSSIVEVSTKDPAQGGSVKLMPQQIASIKRGEGIRVLSKGDKGFLKKLNQALSDTGLEEELNKINTGFQEPTSRQLAQYEFDSNLPGDDCREAVRSSSSKFSANPFPGECDDDQNIPQQLPPLEVSVGAPGSSPVTLEINFQ